MQEEEAEVCTLTTAVTDNPLKVEQEEAEPQEYQQPIGVLQELTLVSMEQQT